MTAARALADVDELDALLEEAGKRGYLWYLFRTDRHGPEVLGGVLRRPGCADVFVVTDADHAHAYRMPTGAGSDVFAPRDVFWWYGDGPVWTLRSLLTLPGPGHPEAPTALAPAPPGSGVSVIGHPSGCADAATKRGARRGDVNSGTGRYHQSPLMRRDAP